MSKNYCRRIPIRFSYDNPEHMRILDKLDDLNLDIHKSKSHFIMNAISFYMDAMDSGDLTNAALKMQKEKERGFVTREELDERLSQIAGDIKAELYEDVIKFLGGMMMVPAVNRAAEVKMKEKEPTLEQEEIPEVCDSDHGEEDLSKVLGEYDSVLSQVMSWSDDE